MSNSSPLQNDPLKSDFVSVVPPSQPDQLPKPDSETAPPAPAISDPDEFTPGEEVEDEEEREEFDEETQTVTSTMNLRIQPPITDLYDSSSDAILTSPTGRRGGVKRKKGKGKPNAKKQYAIELKLQTLRRNLNPIPFVAKKILDFGHNEKILRKLGLWEFIQVDFDRTIRVEFVAQLVVNYNSKLRSSIVNGCRVMVNRADLARALKLPVKKERAEVEFDSDDLSDNSIAFVLGLLSDWVLLHDDTWLMPNEVADWMKLIKEKEFEKMDWAGMIWFMVEKELKQGDKLRDCYYASHLQNLIKCQHGNLFVDGDEEENVKEMELVSETEREVEDGYNEENGKKIEEAAEREVEVVAKAEREMDDGYDVEDGYNEEREVEVVAEAEGEMEDGYSEENEKENEVREVEVVAEAEREVEDGYNEENEEPEVEVVAEVDEEVGDGDHEDNEKESDAAESTDEGPSTELTLGQDGEKEDEEGGVKDLVMMDVEKCKDISDKKVGGDDSDDDVHDHDQQEQQQWLLNQENHFLQPCTAEKADDFSNFDDEKDEEEEMDEDEDGEEDADREVDEDVEQEEDEARNNFHVFPNDDSLDGDGFTSNFLQGLEGNQMAFTSQEQLRNASSVDARVNTLHISSTSSFFNNSGKRVIEHNYDHSVNDNNSKRMRMNETWDNKPLDFAMCMEQIQQVAQKARMLYEEKEQAVQQAAEQSGINQQILLNEVQKRDAMIEHLHKARLEEMQKKDFTINRLERELYLMVSVLDGYRKALKETRKAFAVYKERTQLHEEPSYRDAGQGGLMLTAAEIERRRKKWEEEFRMNCLYVEQKMKEVEEEYVIQFHDHVDRINFWDNKLVGLKADAIELIALHSKRKTSPNEQEVEPVFTETLPVPEPMVEEVVAKEVFLPEPVPVQESVDEEGVVEEVFLPEPVRVQESVEEEGVAEEVFQPEPVPAQESMPEDSVAKEVFDSESLPVPEGEEQVAEVAADDQPTPQPDEKAAEVAEPLSVG